MNPPIETLNRFGENALQFAWPMFWQSSVLIAVLFAIDFALRRRVRAAVRYALWLVLLVKLLLPPSLALPTSAAWWLFPAVTTPARPHVTKFVVNYGADTAPSLPLQPIPAFTPPPRPPMSAVAWIILAWSAISVCLLVWLAARWRQVICDVKRATPAPAWLNELFDEAKDSSGLRRNVRLRLTDQAMSPAVCGLFRPVILLPQSLVQKLPPAQLRAVLLHELTHLRRGDVWINCAQALVQIVYWWHPLLWLANARTRSVREEAVDDAVMLALRDDAEAYAPTLLEVAKLAFHRPLASLGLVGILESRSALRQRIERLVNFHAPRKAGLTFVSLCGVCIFSAVALPMGKAAVSAGNQPVSQVDASDQNLTVKVNPEVFIKNVKAEAATYMHAPTDDYTDILLDILRGEGVDCVPPHGLAFNTKTGEITTQNTPEALEIFRQVIEQLNRPDGKCALPMGFSSFHRKSVVITGQFYKMRTADFDNLVQGLDTHNNKHGGVPWWSVSPDYFNSFNEHVKSLGLSPFQRPRVQTSHGVPAQLYCGTETNGIDLSCLPFVTVDGTNGAVDLAVRVNTKGWFTDNPAGDWPTFVGTNSYAISARAWAEDHGGIVLRVENPSSSEVNNLVVVLGVQIVTNNPPPVKTSERLEAIVDRSHKDTAADLGKTRAVPETSRNASPQVFSGITNKPASSADVSTNLDTRTFMVNLNSGLANLRKKTGFTEFSTPDEYLRGFSKLLATSGTTLPPTSIWLKENGLLLVRGTPQELDAVGQTVSELNGFPARKPRGLANSGTIIDNTISTTTETGNPTDLFTRTFKVDPITFYQGLKSVTAQSFGSTNISLVAKQLFTALGLNLDPPKSVFFNDRLGVLFVHATEQDLDTIGKAIQALITPAAQIHIKARFIEAPTEMVKSLSGTFVPADITNAAGILTGPNFRLVLHNLEQSKGTETLAEPEVTTVSDRQTQMRATEIISVINGINPQARRPPGVSATNVMQIMQIETGPVLDVIPHLMGDGCTLDLNVTAGVTEFTGYDERGKTNIAIVYVDGRKQQVNIPIPQITTRELKTNLRVRDGQTILLSGVSHETLVQHKEQVPGSGSRPTGESRFREQTTRIVKKQLLVLITATLIDPAGNRIHGDDEMSPARTGIPPQNSP